MVYWLQLALPAALALAALCLLARGGAIAYRFGQRRTWLLLVLRALLLGLLLLAAVNPAWLRPGARLQRPRLVILRDVSASMQLPGAAAVSRSAEVANRLADPVVAQALQRFTVVVADFASGLTPGGGAAAPPGQATDLAGALAQARALYSPEAVVVVSDGAETRGEGAAAAADAGRAGTTVWTVGVGETTPPPDIGPVSVAAPRVVKENQAFPVAIDPRRARAAPARSPGGHGCRPARQAPAPPR